MSEPKNTPSDSYMLGKFVAMVQTMDESVPNHKPKGDDWGEQLLPLFYANLDSTMEMIGRVLRNTPSSVVTLRGEKLSQSQLQKLMESINFQSLRLDGVAKKGYLSGYLAWRGENERTPSDHSFNLGVFMAVLTCMETASKTKSATLIVNELEDIFLLLQVNFNNTLTLAEKILATLPATAAFMGKEISVDEVIQAYRVLDLPHFQEHPLDFASFQTGFQEVMADFPQKP